MVLFCRVLVASFDPDVLTGPSRLEQEGGLHVLQIL
jgi:hypothetical protein